MIDDIAIPGDHFSCFRRIFYELKEIIEYIDTDNLIIHRFWHEKRPSIGELYFNLAGKYIVDLY